MTILKFLSAWHAKSLLAFLICSCLSACALNESPRQPVAPDILLGTWRVDLRPTPDSEPYYKEFVVTSVRERSFEGTFYDTTISQARINTDWGKLRIAFVTADGSGAYNHSAVLEDNKLEGLSNSTGRNFLSFWSAVKQ
jgi:hypothetical protein